MSYLERIISYFNGNPFGSEKPVLSILSVLPPNDRIEIINSVIVNDRFNSTAYYKLSLAYFKNGDKETAKEVLNNALHESCISDEEFILFNDAVNSLDDHYQGKYLTSITYDDSIKVLRTKVSKENKTKYNDFYQLVLNYALSEGLTSSLKEKFDSEINNTRSISEILKEEFYVIDDLGFNQLRFEATSYLVFKTRNSTESEKTDWPVDLYLTQSGNNLPALKVVIYESRLYEYVNSNIYFNRYRPENNQLVFINTENNEIDENDPVSLSIVIHKNIIKRLTLTFKAPIKVIDFYK